MEKKKHLQDQLPDRILFAGSINSFETNTNNTPHSLIDLKYAFLPGHHPKLYHVWSPCSSYVLKTHMNI